MQALLESNLCLTILWPVLISLIFPLSQIAREFVGRLMADPGFAQKFVMESLIAASASMLYEYRARGEKFKQELDLAAINTIGLAAATAATVWLLAPTRSYGSVHKFPWQQVSDTCCWLSACSCSFALHLEGCHSLPPV